MELLFLLVLAAIVGYYLAGLRSDDEAKSSTTPRGGPVDRVSDWWGGLFRRKEATSQFRTWALGPGEAYFPEDFKTWLKGLSSEEARAFETSLDEYAAGLGYKLHDLTEGKGTNRARMQVFVEAIVVYSQEYRKIKEAQKKAQKEDGKEKAEGNGAAGEKQVAEKRASRRKRRETSANAEHGSETSESAAAA